MAIGIGTGIPGRAVSRLHYACSADECWMWKTDMARGDRAGIVGRLWWVLLDLCNTRSAWRAARSERNGVFPIGFAISGSSSWFPNKLLRFRASQDFLRNAYFWRMLGVLFRISEFPAKSSCRANNRAKQLSNGSLPRSCCRLAFDRRQWY